LRVAVGHVVGQRGRRPLDQPRGQLHRNHDWPVAHADLAVRRAPDLQRTTEAVVGVAARLVETIRHAVDEHLLAEAVRDRLQVLAQHLPHGLPADGQCLDLPLAEAPARQHCAKRPTHLRDCFLHFRPCQQLRSIHYRHGGSPSSVGLATPSTREPPHKFPRLRLIPPLRHRSRPEAEGTFWCPRVQLPSQDRFGPIVPNMNASTAPMRPRQSESSCDSGFGITPVWCTIEALARWMNCGGGSISGCGIPSFSLILAKSPISAKSLVTCVAVCSLSPERRSVPPKMFAKRWK